MTTKIRQTDFANNFEFNNFLKKRHQGGKYKYIIVETYHPCDVDLCTKEYTIPEDIWCYQHTIVAGENYWFENKESLTIEDVMSRIYYRRFLGLYMFKTVREVSRKYANKNLMHYLIQKELMSNDNSHHL